MKLRVATYNIHAGVGSDGRFNPQRIGAVIRRLDAHLIALQEVVSVGPDGFALLEDLANASDMTAIPGPTMLRGDAEYGNAILTRLPVRQVRQFDLSVPRYEPRGALCIEFHWGDLRVRTLATHLGLRPRERRRQVVHLLGHLDGACDAELLLGDLNEPIPGCGVLRLLGRRYRFLPPRRTFPAHRPLLPLDRILWRGRLRLQRFHPLTESTPHTASDHQPLVAEFTAAETG